MVIEHLRTFKPIIGDDNPYYSFVYDAVPQGYRFDDLVFPERCPLTLALKDRLIDYCNRYYRHHEIVGNTFEDFKQYLQIALDTNIDNYEKFLAVYEDDIALPILGRTIKRTYSSQDESASNNNRENTGTVGVVDNSTAKDYDLPIDNQTAQEVNRTVTDGTNTRTDNLNEYSEQNASNTHEGVDIEEWSDVGVTDNWDKLNGFLNNNPTIEMEFTKYFEGCFTIYEDLKW